MLEFYRVGINITFIFSWHLERSIQPKFPEISVQNSMDRFGPTGKVSKKLVHLLRWTTFPSRTGLNFGWMDRAQLRAESTFCLLLDPVRQKWIELAKGNLCWQGRLEKAKQQEYKHKKRKTNHVVQLIKVQFSSYFLTSCLHPHPPLRLHLRHPHHLHRHFRHPLPAAVQPAFWFDLLIVSRHRDR